MKENINQGIFNEIETMKLKNELENKIQTMQLGVEKVVFQTP